MSDSGRRWDDRYRTESVPTQPDSFVVDDLAPLLEQPGRALDVAGGAGRNSLWLASRAWEVTLVDVSSEAVRLATAEADARALNLETVVSDLDTEPLPPGPWDLILIIHYLQRRLFAALGDSLAPGGLLALSIATRRNLEQHPRPPLPYLLEEGEAATLVAPLRILSSSEGWRDDRHEARVIARRP